ncbi:unnamed protein product [Symbiodinium natans]|uniref:Sulfotransferase domain-containing protein n=1 Tax=Symbiodinium natans TaxID=878477 RepID=A0A812S516_9DINO|nr:unnamed protein product [Symbiodinium natans]
MAGPSVCSFCNRWWSTSGAPICGLCRIARAVAALPLDNRVNNTNYDLATSILERALGEVNSWLAVPLAEAQGTVENIPSPPGSGAVEGDLHSGEDSPRSRDLGKDKRSDRQQERRAERREVKRQPPPPPPDSPPGSLKGAGKVQAKGESRKLKKPDPGTHWVAVENFEIKIGDQLHLRGTYKGKPAECIGQVQALVQDTEGSWMRLSLTGSPNPEIQEWKQAPTGEFYANRKPLVKPLSTEVEGLFCVQDVREVDPTLEWKSNLVDLIRHGAGLQGLEALAQDLGYGSGGIGPMAPPVPEARAPVEEQTKKLKGAARVRAMLKQSHWSWRNSSLDPLFKRPKISLKRKREASSGSSMSKLSLSEAESDQEDLFPEEAQAKHIARKCPGLLARHAMRAAHNRLCMGVGEDARNREARPVFVKYFRQVFSPSCNSPPMRREYLTLATCVDCIVEGSVLKMVDYAVQRMKALEQIAQGASPHLANRLELIPAEVSALASTEEARSAAQEQRREDKARSSWAPRGKGKWDQPWGKGAWEESNPKGQGVNGSLIAVPIEDYWKSRSVNGYGEEIHSASYFAWANVKHSLPSKDVAGILDGAEVSTGGVKDFLMHPEKYLKPEATRTWMKCPRVMVKEDQWEEVCAGLVERGVCDVIPVSEVLHVDGKPILGGLFGVPKMEEADGVPVLRLIMDLRPINQCFESIAGDLGTLPMLSQLFPLEVFTEENVLLSSEDIKAMFYIVGLPEVWRPLLAFGREVPSSLAIPGAGPCVLCSRVLPMGFINSVAVAQALHREIVNCAVDRFGINRDAEIRRDQPLPSSATAYRVYLDNFDVLAKTNREASLLLEGQLGPLASELRQVYEELKVPINEKKSVKSGLRGEMQGALVDGVQGLVYIFSYRRCLMSCLNEVWRFIASFEGHLHQWKEIPQAVKQELFCSMSLTPLAMMNLRAPYDAMATASDASESGGGLSYTSGLTPFGAAASLKPVRGVTHRTPDDEQVLVVSVFDGIAACRVALDVVGAQVAGYVSIEPDAAARRVVESAFGSTEFVDGVQDVTDDTVIRELLAKHFSWAKVHVMLDSVSSMPDEYRARMTKSIGLLPYQVDALGITPCRRARFFWFDWVVKAEVGVAIATPTSTSSWDYGKLDFHLDCPSDAFLSPGWKLAGGTSEILCEDDAGLGSTSATRDRIPFEPWPSDVFLAGVMGSGITMLTQVAHGLRSNGNMSFDDINEVVPWFHAALICGQNLDELQPFKPRLFKTHQLHEKLPEDAKFVVLFRDPRKIFLTRYRRFCNSSWTDYARVPRGAISLENFAVGIFGHESSNEAWKFMRSWISCCLGSQRVLFVAFEDLLERPRDEIRRIGTFISPHGRISDAALAVAHNHSTRRFMQEHISQFDDHFVLKHLKPFEEEVMAYGRLPRIPKIWTESLPQ